MSADSLPFWRAKTLGEMSDTEWESLCDGCGRCCLVKLEEEVAPPAPGEAAPNPRIFFTDVGCRLLDDQTCGCRNYPNRSAEIPECVRLTPAVVAEIGWLPPTCAYRLVAEGRDLYWWHHLVSGDRDTVHAAGISVRGRVAGSEDEVPGDALEDHIVNWPLRVPRKLRPRGAAPGGPPAGAPTPASPRPAARALQAPAEVRAKRRP